MKTLRFAALALTAAMLLASGCGGGSDGLTGTQTDTTTPPPVTPPTNTARASVEGQVLNASTGAVIAGAIVKSGTATATTGADGRYTLQVSPGDRVVLNVNATGFAEGASIASVAENGTVSSVTKLLPVSNTTTISNTTGGTATVPNSTAAVILPAGAFGTASLVNVELTVINPAQDPTQMPGDFMTSTGERMESFGAIIVTPRDAAGNTLQLASGKSATIRIPLSTRGTPSATIPLFYFDTTRGVWVQEGSATLTGTAPNQYYEGTVTHFTAWNADQTYNSILVNGCVQTATGTRVSGVTVMSDGIDYSGAASATTNAEGKFSVAIKKNARAAITGVQSGRLTNSVSVGPSATDITLSSCLTLSDVNNSITMRLTWGETPADVDSHLFTPNGDHVYFSSQGSLAAAPFAALDVDDTDSFGPEVVTLSKLMVGTYTYGVHNYSGETSPGMTASPVRVELNVAGRIQVFTLPAGETASTMFARLFTITVDARCNATVTAVNQWETDVPAASTPTTPTYCTP